MTSTIGSARSRRALAGLAVLAVLTSLPSGAAHAATPPPAPGAPPVVVTAGVTTPGINVQLDTGGSISGRLVDAKTHQPVVGMAVAAFASGRSFGSAVVFTGNSGAWTIGGLPASSKGYLICAYNEVDSESARTSRAR